MRAYAYLVLIGSVLSGLLLYCHRDNIGDVQRIYQRQHGFIEMVEK